MKKKKKERKKDNNISLLKEKIGADKGGPRDTTGMYATYFVIRSSVA